MRFRYRIVDVFTTRQFEGNPLAVFPEAQGLPDATMQKIARELNLSETVFIFPPDSTASTARLRIFTPARELPFAGHPTVGASFVIVDEDTAIRSPLILEEGVGPVRVRIDEANPPMFWLTTPPVRDGITFDRPALAAVLGLTAADTIDVQPQLLDAGNPTVLIALRDKAAVDRASLDSAAFDALRKNDARPCCLVLFTPTADGAYTRMFAPDYGVREDPATGSATGPLALFMMRNRLAPRASRFVSEQGTRMGRRSFLHIDIKGEMGREGIEVGGHVTPVAEGSMTIQ